MALAFALTWAHSPSSIRHLIPIEIKMVEHWRSTSSTEPKRIPPQQKAPRVELQSPAPVPISSSVAASDSSLIGSVSSDTGGQDVDHYAQQLMALLQKRKVYPRMARQMGHTGRVLVRLKVLKSGEIKTASIVEPSPYTTLNQAVQNLLVDLPPLESFPVSMNHDEWIFNIPIEFKM